MFYCLDGLCKEIFNYAEDNTLWEEDYDINVIVDIKARSGILP